MRIALISDIHGNAVALEAVIAAIRHGGVDQIICLGDVATLGPEPDSAIEMLQELNCPCVLGNHDEFLLDPHLIHSYTDVSVVIEAVDWCRDRLAAKHLAFLETFQPRIELQVDKQTSILFYHGSPRSHMENLLATTSPGDLDRMLGGYSATVMIGGHTHIQMLRQHHGMLIVNPGSVGLPFKEFETSKPPRLLQHAEYALIDIDNGAINVSLRRIPLNKALLHRAVEHSHHPLSTMLEQQYR